MAIFGLKEITREQAKKLAQHYVKEAIDLAALHQRSPSRFVSSAPPLQIYGNAQAIHNRLIYAHFKEEPDCQTPIELIDCIYIENPFTTKEKFFWCQHDPGECPVYQPIPNVDK